MPLDGVESVTVDFDKKLARVVMQPGKELTSEAVTKAFAGTHYAVGSFEELAP